MRRCERDARTRALVHAELLERFESADEFNYPEGARLCVPRLGLVDGGRGSSALSWGGRRSSWRESWQEPDVLRSWRIALEQGDSDEITDAYRALRAWLRSPAVLP